tara:strand:+ start:280 stop:2181 length:1902 start_codon:yes stop_codon:yes gene_type:complete
MSIFEANCEWNNKVKEKIKDADKVEIISFFEELDKKWTVKSTDMGGIISSCYDSLNMNKIETVDIGILQLELDKAIYETTLVHTKFKRLVPEYKEYSARWNKIYEVIFYGERVIRDTYLLHKTNNEDHDSLSNEDPDVLFKYSRFTDDSKKTPYQCLLLYMIEQFAEDGFSKFGGNLYKPFLKNGNNTHAWKKHCAIKEYIYKKTDHKTNFIQWKNATSNAGNINSAEKYFNEFIGPELPELKKDRHLFAFRNGNYITKYNTAPDGEPPFYEDIFVPYGTKHPYITNFSVAAKYHDQVFNNYDEYKDDWFKIIQHCPTFKSLLDYQELPEDVQRWLCVFMGRKCFNLGDLDNWQCLLYLLGQAGTGKSTVLMKILQKWYDEEDVGIISNNIDTKFGIKPHVNKFMVLAPEISENFKMEQTDWQLLVEGGRNTYSEKYKNDETIEWKLHMTMGGNKIMRYKNNSESVSRRTVVVNFWKKVVKTDTAIDKKLSKEMPAIMKLCISAYYSAIREHGVKGIWDILPKYFHENKEDMEQTTNSLQNFLKSGKIIYGDKYYVPAKVFCQEFNEHVRENNLPKEQFTKDYYGGIFTNNGIKVIQQGSKEYPRGSGIMLKRTMFFKGIDILNENVDEEDPE